MVALLAIAGAMGPACGSTNPDAKGKSDASAGGPAEPTPPAAQARVELDLFVLGRVRGTIAPCGCTTEPLGGLQYAFGYIEASSDPGARLVLEPGSFLFPEPGSPEWPVDDQGWSQAQERAKALQGRFSGLGGALVSGLGPIDVRSPTGAAALQTYAMPRVIANVTPAPDAIPPHRLVTLAKDGVTLTAGVTAVVDPTLPEADQLGTLSDPIAALRQQVSAMREAGAGFTVAMAHGTRPFAEQIAREVDGLDLVVVGVVQGVERQRIGESTGRLSGTYIVEPGEQLQTLTHLTLSVAAEASVVPESEAWVMKPPRAVQEDELARLQQRLDKFKADPSADPAFIARLESERDTLQTALEGGGPQGPAVAVFEQVKVSCKLPADAQAGQGLTAYTAWVAQQNEAFYKGKHAPEPPKGTPGYAGLDECETCHEEAVEHWRTTVHARAYQTLVDTNQQYDLACVGCHVTGFREPGGSEVVETRGLRDVQCEVCHGPGTFHVEEPEARQGGAQHIRLQAPEEVCGKCHTPEHSDTFDYVAYMRDILGSGHGDEARKALGDGPTGAQLRAEGLAKAGGKCKKM
ncbi:multiheme c-type cytochrome [Paraliomyxa miuraensis]|uniref:multiheme c-type cytochrome n=1 Tax=Paraliomyxa miuraensis TaxID=376150 RepID=UPI00224E35A7|nr:multiheme c-type cytochrome [Paraliomyxa miuraensis]MCX4239208.1 multiheme c-type cytochrome [Paraliomyxa miuraensis]